MPSGSSNPKKLDPKITPRCEKHLPGLERTANWSCVVDWHSIDEQDLFCARVVFLLTKKMVLSKLSFVSSWEVQIKFLGNCKFFNHFGAFFYLEKMQKKNVASSTWIGSCRNDHAWSGFTSFSKKPDTSSPIKKPSRAGTQKAAGFFHCKKGTFCPSQSCNLQVAKHNQRWWFQPC